VHEHLTADPQEMGPQKMHIGSIPRIGGLSIIMGLSLAILFHSISTFNSKFEIFFLFFAFLAFLIGIIEDITKKLSISFRFIAIYFIACYASYALEIKILRSDVPGLDYLLTFTLFTILFSAFSITGLSNAFNIIDGFNGLASIVGTLTLLGIAYVSFKVGDYEITNLSLIMASSILGFFIWNYPRGLIFLGDSGAYLIGFWIACLSILLVTKNSQISPWFALLVNGYPISETLFSIYRRKIHQKKSLSHPDAMHFHSLIFRRVLKTKTSNNRESWYIKNAKTSPYLWVLSSLAIVPAILWWHSTGVLILFSILYFFFYIKLYESIVKFKLAKILRN
jgi:UDP-N-acetylmuramyl pentapeptide phosphotransferase/UDP-N-acetylglucosamine-1-phosphate transferase